MKAYLLIEDDIEVGNIIEEGLRKEGFQGDRVGNGLAGLQLLKTKTYDVVVLDIMVPELNGLKLLEKVQELRITTPILVLSALAAAEDRIAGLSQGADDYLCKPFSVAELQMRINKLMARSKNKEDATTVCFGELILNRLKRTVTYRGKILDITGREFRLLDILVSNPNKVIGKAQILRDIFDYKFIPATNVVDVLMCRLRGKIEEASEDVEISTVRGLGYTLRASWRGRKKDELSASLSIDSL